MTSPRERAQLQAALRQQQEALVRDLLPVLDALDRAECHWRQVVDRQVGALQPPQQRGWWLFWRWWGHRQAEGPGRAEASAALARSAGEGIDLIRSQLLDVLRAHGLESFESVGQSFDPQRMRALGQRPVPEGSAVGQVLEEAVRGYGWHGKLLREAQVLVAGP